MQVGYDGMKFMLICFLTGIKFNDSSLEDVYKIDEQAIVGLLLLSGRKTGVY